MKNSALEPVERVKIIAAGLSDKKVLDITAYDVRSHSSITDFHILATGLNPPHLKAMLNETHLRMKAHNLACYRKSGTPESGWIVADYLDVMVHLFSPDARKFYALDALWDDMPRMDFTDPRETS